MGNCLPSATLTEANLWSKDRRTPLDPPKEGNVVNNTLFVRSALALALAAPLMAQADSQLASGAPGSTGDLTAAANLDIRVVIPRVLFLGVGPGAGSPLTVNGAVSEITFDFSGNPLAVGTGAAAGSITSTNTASGTAAIPVRVFGNNGQVTISAGGDTVLTSGSDTIPITQLSVATDNAALPAPTFTGGNSTPTPSNRVTNLSANWTFSYLNTAQPAAGTYTGTVTYTATMP